MAIRVTAVNIDDIPLLAPWQRDFVDRFLLQQNAKSLLVAPVGSGKTATTLVAANEMLLQGVVDSLLVISDRPVIRDQWSNMARRYGIELGMSFEDCLHRQGVSATLQSLRTNGTEELIEEAAREKRWLIVADDPAYETGSLVSLVDQMLKLNNRRRSLFISRNAPLDLSFDSQFRFKSELMLAQSILEAPPAELRLARFSPSFSLLRRLQAGPTALDEISWRDFERLIASLLETDGYNVELMRGSKDGGVDVIAVKDLGPSGYFKTLWQAKKWALSNKVGLSVVRELADTRQELGASKGVIVTSSYLTRGALERIKRDKYLLGKVDRQDLDAWIHRTLFGKRNS